MFYCCSQAAAGPPTVVVAGVTIPYSIKVCDLGMTLNTCTQGYISDEIKLWLVKVLVIPQFLFGDVLFRMADSTSLRKLQVAFNNCVRFVYGLRQ
jgi:hypothetical protein